MSLRVSGLIGSGMLLLGLGAIFGLGSIVGLSAPAHAAVPNPTVTGPVAATAIPGDPSHNYPF